MRLNERSFVVVVAGLLVVAMAAALAWVLLFREDGETAPVGGSGGNAASSFAGGPPEVLLLSGSTLVRRNVEEQTEELIADIPSPNVYAAPGSPWLAYVTTKRGGNDDFAAEPVLHLYDVESEEKSGHGAGVSPVWNPAGTHVAFLRPVEPRDCVGESCSGDVQVGVIEAATGRESLLLEPGRYTVLGWAGEWVLVSDFDAPGSTISVSLDDERKTLDMPPSQLWGASPDGRWVIKTNAKRTEFIAMADGELGEERIAVELGHHELLEGAWSHDSSTVAAVTRLTAGTHKGGKKMIFVEGEPTTQIMTFSPESPEIELVPRTYGASGGLFWDPSNEAIVFASLLDPKRALFQARHCPLGNSGSCSIVTSWTEGVALLRAE